MEIQLQELEYCRYEACYSCDATDPKVLDKKQQVLKVFEKQHVPGNRKGKASIQTIESYYGKQIKQALKTALIEEAYHDVLFEKELKASTHPSVLEASLSKDKFECKLIIETQPEFELQDVSGLEIPKPYIEVDVEQLVQAKLEDLRKRNAKIRSFDESEIVQDGDSLIVSYEGFIDDEKSDMLSAEGEMLTVGSSKIKEFDTNLLGLKLGESIKFDVQVQETAMPSLIGKKVSFDVTLLAGSKTELLPLDDELAKSVNYQSLQELKVFLEQAVYAQIQLQEAQQVNDAVGKKVVSMHSFEVPKYLVERQAESMARVSGLQLSSLKEEDQNLLKLRAQDSIKLSIILDKIRSEDPESQLSDEEVFDIMRKKATEMGQGQMFEQIVQSLMQSNKLSLMFQQIRDSHTLETIAKKATLIS